MYSLKELGRSAVIVLIAWLALESVACAQQFTPIALPIPGLRYGSIAWGDFNNDGNLDLLVTGDTGAGFVTRIYRNDGGGHFVDIQAGLPGISGGAAAWGDYNGDGYLDFALTGMTSTGRVTRIYRNNGDGTFTDINANLPGLDSAKLAWGDYDNDGDLDLFVTGYTGSAYFARIYRNDGNDKFSDSGVTTVTAGASGAAAWADFDNDGDLDLLFAGFTGDTTTGQSSRLYRNNNGSFTNITAISLTAMSLCSVAWEDYDNDGNLDLLMAGSSIAGVQSYPTLRLYHNNGNGAGFTSINTGMAGAQNCSLAWGDFDNDGYPDVALAGYNTSFAPFARVYRNLGGGVFADSGANIAGVIDAALAWGDFDNDGDLDLLVTGFDGATNVIWLYRNDTPFSNAVPVPPGGLNAAVSAKTVTFSWNAGSDANQSGGFSYNLRVGTAPGADNVMPSQADPASGRRRLPALGNVNERLSWTLKLPVGSYYWSAQTIDHAFAGSPFAAEQTFNIPPQAPDVATLAATNVNLDNATLCGAANPNGDATVVYFEYGTTTSYGSTTSPQNLGSGVSQVSFTALITNLLPAATYQFRAVASNGFGVSYGTNQSFFTPLFTEVATINLLGVGSGSVAWGDYDNDGYLDLLIAGGTSSNQVTRIYRNLGGTNFVDIQAGLPGISGGQVAWGDFDNDGKLDVLLTGNGISRIFHNDGGNIFTDINAGLPGLSTGASGAWADFDNDGDLDFAITGAGGFPVKTYRNDGTGQFTDLTNSLPKLSDSSIAWADYDNNGSLDLLVTGYNYGVGGLGEMTRLYRNDGHGNFTNSNISFQAVSRGSVAWGDYNNDGNLDFLLTGSTGSGQNRYSLIYSNNGAGGFVSKSISTVAKMDQSCVAWGDYNNDGALDFAATGMTSTGAVVKVYRNDGGTVFHDSGAALPGLSGGSLAWGDFDNDGRLDLIVTGYNGSNYVAKIYRNNSLTTNTPPNAPGGLSASVVNDAVTLTWGAATDPNQTGGLSYNLRLGTAPGLGDIVGPMAGPTGFRRVPRLGNVNTRLSWTITNLNVGTLYWSVQAIDHSFAGSPFAPEASFVMPPRAPRAVTIGATNITAASATLTGQANPNGQATTVYFEYGATTNYGARTATQDIGAGTRLVAVALPVTGLSVASTNQFRLVASNSLGVVYGNNLTLVTLPQFTELTGAIPGLSANYTAQWGDYNQDGTLDVLFTGFDGSANLLRVYRCVNSTTFALETNAALAQISGAVAWGDFNGDGVLDFAICGGNSYNTDYSTLIYRNDGNGVFTDIGAGLAGVANGTVNWVDYDNDGDLDLFVTGRDSGGAGFGPSCRLYRNDGNGVFTQVPVPMPGVLNSAVAWGDYDNDGWPDVLLTGNDGTNNVTRLFHNNGGGSFTEVPTPIPGVQNGAVAWGDYDNDGRLDILISGDTGSNYVSKVYHNNGDGTFTEISTPLPGMTGSAVAWGDYDNDGRLDILISGTTNGAAGGSSTFLFHNEGGGSFVNSGAVLPGVSSGTVAWGDYDHDGDLDLLLVGPNGQIHLMRNNQPVADALPSAPGGLSATVSGSGVTLRWAAATDANQSSGLAYNVRVGTSPGLGNLASPEADPATGLRQLPQLGNAWLRLNYSLTNLAVGTYYWAVQAIDSAFAGSAFSSEASFTIPPRRPDAITLPATNVLFNAATLSGLANPNGLAAAAWFQYGTTANYGSTTLLQNIGSGTAPLPVSSSISGLSVGLTYSFRLVVSNSLGVAYGTNLSFTTPQFTEVATGLPQVNSGQNAWGDYNGDGVMDVFIASSSVNGVFLGSGAGTFTNIGIAFPGSTSVAWGDYDNDGDLDLLVASSTATYIYRNDGSNTFTPINLGTPPTYATVAAAWGDYDNDGRLDFVLCGGGSTRLYRNAGGNQFVNSGVALPGVYGGSVAWGDYDNDGNPDLLLTGSTSSSYDVLIANLYRNDGHGGLTNIGAGLPGMYNSSIAWGDYDRDGRLDILMSGTTITGAVTLIFHNDGGGVFHDIGAGLPPTANGTAAWGDFDNDGYLDILLTAIPTGGTFDPYVSRVYRNNGNGTFTGQDLPFSGWYGDRGAWADYDNDGDLDIMVLGANNAMTKLFRNNAQTPNSRPNPPSGLAATLNGNSVILAWSAATDPNQNGGLSYNLRVGTTPGGSDVVAPMANLADGFRRLPQPGNVNQALARQINLLKVGTYYWSVQAVDNSFAGSAFAAEGVFVIPAQKPNLVPGVISNLMVDGVTLNVRANPNGSNTLTWFQYELTTNYSSLTSAQSAGNGINWLPASATLAGLLPATVYHYRAAASNSFGVAFGPDQTFRTLQFTSTDIAFLATEGGVAPADFDNDGNMDFLVTSAYSPGTTLYRNDGHGNFTAFSQPFYAVRFGQAVWGDYDRDGNVDCAICGWDPATLNTLCQIYRNTGSNTFTLVNSSLPGGYLSWGDFDNDGDLDLLMSQGGSTVIARNDGGGQFTLLTNSIPIGGCADWGDYDNDGDLDFFITGVDPSVTGNPRAAIIRNDGPGGFVDSGIILSNLSGTAAWGDYDNDGRLDLVLSGAATPKRRSWLR